MIGFIKMYFEREGNQDVLFKADISYISIIRLIETPNGRIKSENESNYFHMKSIINEDGGWIKGSLQVCHNSINEEFNYEDLTYSDLAWTIDHLTNKIVDVQKASITNLEFGLNIIPIIPYDEIIRKYIYLHKLNGYNHNKRYHVKGILRHFEYTNYHFMILNKARQINSDDNVLRFELRLIKSVEIQKIGIHHFPDLKDKDVLKNLKELFIKRFDELTIIDDFQNRNDIPEEVKAKLNNYIDPIYWEDISKTYTRQTKSRHKKDFEKIQTDYNLNQIKDGIRSSLNNQFNILFNN